MTSTTFLVKAEPGGAALIPSIAAVYTVLVESFPLGGEAGAGLEVPVSVHFQPSRQIAWIKAEPEGRIKGVGGWNCGGQVLQVRILAFGDCTRFFPCHALSQAFPLQGCIKRRLSQTAEDRQAAPDTCHVCLLCGRSIPPLQRDAHHLVPKLRGDVQTAWLHRICHRQIHAWFTESELERLHHHVEALRSHPEMARFLEWVRRKPDDFHERTRKSQRLRRR